MKVSELEASLYCTRCHDETLHHVKYLNDKIQCIECTNCHRKIEMDLNPLRELYKEVYKRITSKPTRLTQEYKDDLNKFIEGLPKRVLSKPYRFKKYYDETREAFRKIKE